MAVRDPLGSAPARDQLNADPAAGRRAAAEAIVGHRFENQGLLTEALTHRSAAHGARKTGRRDGPPPANSNERLEFIGDRVLGLLIAEWLIERFPEEEEGELGPRHAHLVSRKVLAEIGEAAGLSAALSIGANEARAGVAQLANVLADGMEALIGAAYLDAGLEPARRFVRSAWREAVESMGLPPKDPKTELQEWLMARGLPLPIYELAKRTGPSHAPEFVMQVSGGGMAGTGTAGSKRLAERDAAADLLARLQTG